MKSIREQLLKAAEPKTETVTVGNITATATELSAEQYLDTLNHPTCKIDDKYDGAAFTALLVARCMRDSDGQRIFADDDAGLLRQGSFSVYRQLAEAANRINGLMGDEVKN